MPEDEWTLVDEAASIIFDGKRRVKRAWRDPSIPFAASHTPFPELESLSKFRSRTGAVLFSTAVGKRAGRPRLWDYEFVEMRTADVERLAQEARTPTPQPPRAARTADAVRREANAAIDAPTTVLIWAVSIWPPLTCPGRRRRRRKYTRKRDVDRSSRRRA